MVSPDAAALTACPIVKNGDEEVPRLASLPVAATYIGPAANTAIGTIIAATMAKTMAKAKSFFFIYSPLIFFYFFIYVFRVSQYTLWFH
jgi:hypothetical protein